MSQKKFFNLYNNGKLLDYLHKNYEEDVADYIYGIIDETGYGLLPIHYGSNKDYNTLLHYYYPKDYEAKRKIKKEAKKELEEEYKRTLCRKKSS